ncbi:MAG: carboxymuconolactone decarboxylase family protein [Betaproteobacteria bacterium]|nr:carboxymuconolactone decarboxylase family protein [Betaproteobacteria bacterium]
MALNEKSSAASSPTREMRYAVLPDRMPPIPIEKMTDAQKKIAAEIAAGPRGKVEGPYWPILRSPEFASHMQKVGAYVRYDCPLDRKINQMAALMVARSWTQQFVWDVHILQALEAGLKPAIAEAIAEGRRPAGMAEDEEILYDFVTELLANKSVSDPTYARTVAKFGEPGIIDILGIIGYHMTLALIMNVSRAPLLEGRSFPLEPTPSQLRFLTPGAALRGWRG